MAESAPEYALKAAFIYNFALFTEWPAQVGPNVTLCVLGSDPFGAELDSLVGEPVGKRRIAVRRIGSGDRLDQCNLLFIARSHIHAIPNVIAAIGEGAVLTVADSPEATQRGVGINMEMERSKITFDINRKVIKRAGLTLSSKMLNLARNVVE